MVRRDHRWPKKRAFDHVAHFPRFCFTDPEIVSVGLSSGRRQGRSWRRFASGQFSVPRQRPRHDAAGRRRLRPRHCRAAADNHVVLRKSKACRSGRIGNCRRPFFRLALEMGPRASKDIALTIHAPSDAERSFSRSRRLRGAGASAAHLTAAFWLTPVRPMAKTPRSPEL